MAALVGRTAETDRVRAVLLGTARRTGPRAVLLTGEAGIGKSSLIAATAPAHGVVAHIAFSAAPLAAPGFGLRCLASALGDAGADLTAQLDHPDSADPDREQHIWQAANAAVTAAGGVLVVDDLQWSDGLTLGWLGQLGDVLWTRRVRLLAAVRTAGTLPPTLAAALLPLYRRGLVTEVGLRPLSTGDVAEVLAAAGLRASVETARLLHARTDGVPVAVTELVREARRVGVHRLTDEWLRRLRAGREMPLFAALVNEQVAALPVDPRELAWIAALAPQPADPQVLRAALGWTGRRYHDARRELVASGLVLVDRGLVAFTHDLHREALADLAPDDRRRDLHAALAQALIRVAGPAAAVAPQLAAAGDTGAAVEWYLRAADEAVQAHDYGTAIRHLRHAFDLADDEGDPARIAAVARQATQLARWARRPDDALEIFDRVRGSRVTAADHAALLVDKARLLSTAGRYPEATALLKEALDAYRALGDDSGVADTLGRLGYAVGGQYPVEQYIAYAREGLALAERIGDTLVTVGCLSALALSTYLAGDVTAFEVWRRAFEVAETRSDFGMENRLALLAGNWATASLLHGDLDGALVVMDRAATLVTPLLSTYSLAPCRAVVEWRSGAWDAALARAGGLVAGQPLGALAPADLVLAAIRLERDRRMTTAGLESATRRALRTHDRAWMAVIQAVAMRVRAARREPQPERGLTEALRAIVEFDVRQGWEDLLWTTARISPALHGQTVRALDGRVSSSLRFEPCHAYAAALVAARTRDTSEALAGAAARFDELGEPYLAAGALAAAGETARRHDGGRTALLAEAARRFTALRADRSLADLLRRNPGVGALAGFAVPPGQAYASSPGLTRREAAVAELMRRGLTTADIAEDLGVALGTARVHVANVRAKFGGVRKSQVARLLNESEPFRGWMDAGS
ncbi:MAG: hypothetical protein QOE45_507 [Frankiaceae bacterium]|jgi:DNA-binding CsgD family transcriptional regulator/tetratricopeptide (TPR) repeat protein|nr:hypothetical protein [Frankiaceae bacterium]